MELQIRAAQTADYPQIEAIYQQVQQLHVDLRPDIYKPVAVALPEEELARGIAEKTFYVAEADSAVRGILSFLVRPVRGAHQVARDVLFIDTMAVDAAYRNSGIGRAFFDFLKQVRRERKLDGIELQVNARNTAAMEMYLHCGFVPKSVNMELPGE